MEKKKKKKTPHTSLQEHQATTFLAPKTGQTTQRLVPYTFCAQCSLFIEQIKNLPEQIWQQITLGGKKERSAVAEHCQLSDYSTELRHNCHP